MKPNTEREFVVVNAGYVAFIFVLSLLSVINTFLLLVVTLPEADRLILIITWGISVILMLDFIYSLIKTRASLDFLIRWHGWMAFIGSLPIPGIAIFRVLHTILNVRKLRSAELSEASQLALRQKGRSAFLTTLFLAVVALELSGILILRAEVGKPDAEITTASDALWWGYVTMSTVGYGDLVPVTSTGRLVGLITVTAGVVLFSVSTGFLTDWFRRDRGYSRSYDVDLSDYSANDPHHQILAIRTLMEKQERTHKANTAELRARLNELEKLIT